jgi:hypothetical protein
MLLGGKALGFGREFLFVGLFACKKAIYSFLRKSVPGSVARPSADFGMSASTPLDRRSNG